MFSNYKVCKLKFILCKINECYELVYKDIQNNESRKINNHEVQIRNRIYEYLDKNNIKNQLGLSEYVFERESPVPKENSDLDKGIADLKIYNYYSKLKDEKDYYLIECKRLDGSKKLNNEYTKEGINRFTSNKYPSNKGKNAMIGFIVGNFDIDKNAQSCLKLTYIKLDNNIKYSYQSEHQKDSSSEFIRLYHLMLDCYNIIKKPLPFSKLQNQTIAKLH